MRHQKLALLLALLLLFAPVPAAHAATTRGSGYTSQGQRCSWLVIHISSDWGRPALWTKGTADNSINNWCDDISFRAPVPSLRVAQDLWAWHSPPNGAPGWWFLCNQGPYITNNVPTHEVNTEFAWWVRPCNSHFFFGEGFAEVNFNGRWHGIGVAIPTPWVAVM